MKKTGILGIAAAAVCSAAVLAACGGNTGGGTAANDKFVGHWDIKTMEAGGEALDIQALMSAAGTENPGSVGMDINSDGNFTLNIYGDEESKGTWKTSGNDSIVLTVNGDDQTATMKDGKLVMTYGEGDQELALYFEKGSTATTEAATTAAETTQAGSTAAETTAAETTQETTAAQ